MRARVARPADRRQWKAVSAEYPVIRRRSATLCRDPPRDARREGHDRHLRIYADAGREEARVGDVEPASAVHRAPAVDDRASGIAAHARRAHRVEPRRHERGGAEMTVAQHGGLARVVELTDARDG